MAAPPSQIPFLDRVLKSRLVTEEQLARLFPDADDRTDPHAVTEGLVKAGLLTRYQVQMLQAGKHRGFFLGPYKILRPIGQGGMGTVFLAEHTSLVRKVAVKVLPPDKAKDKLSLERFHREARAAAALDHPNIVRLHDISQGNGVHFLVMEYVDGTDLQSLMGQTGPLHYAQAAQYVAQAAAGLQHAHEKGFIHRDIKPANLMLAKTGGGIKILDMGLARSFTDARDSLTANLGEGDIAGTVDYLSPEQAMNQTLDARSDIYSLGATFYSLVAGHPPFKGTTAQKLMQHQLKEPPSVSMKLSGRVPQALSDVISKMMAKKPNDRFQSAADVIDALGPWLPVPTTGNIVTDLGTHTPMPSARSSGRTQPIRKSSRALTNATTPTTPLWKKSAVLIGAGVGMLVLVGGIITALILSVGDSSKSVAINPPQDLQPSRPTPPTPVPHITLDFEGLRPTSEVVGSSGRGVVLNSVGGQRLPAGVIVNHYDIECVAEYSLSVVNGATAFGLRATNRRAGAQVHFFTDGTLGRLPEGTRGTLRLTYSFEGTGSGQTFYELVGEPYTKYSTTKLPATGGQWKTVDLPFTRPVGGTGYEFVVNAGFNPPADGTLYVRSVELLSPEDAAAATPSPAASVVAAIRADFAPLTSTPVTVSHNGADVGGGWWASVYEPDAAGRLDVSGDVGGRVVTLTNTGGTPSVQLFQSKPAGKLAAGTPYLLKLEYLATEGTTGLFDVRESDVSNWKDCPYSFKLEPTGGQWESRTFEIEATRDYPTVFVIQNRSEADGNRLSVRKLELVPVGGTAATASPPADTRVAYALDLAGQKPFTVRRKARDTTDLVRTGDGMPPAGWRSHSWEPSCEHELFSEDKDGSPTLGLRFVSGQGAGMMAVDGIAVRPKSTYELTFEYQTPGDFIGENGVRYRTSGNGGKLNLGGKLDKTDGKWVTKTLQIKTDTTSSLQLEFHHNGPGGEQNPLLIRKCKLTAID